MKIEVGDTVKLNNGEVHEVERMSSNCDPNCGTPEGFGPFVIDGLLYHENGRFADFGPENTLSVRHIISRASDDTQSSQEVEPKLWSDMTNEEKAKVPDDVLNDPANPLRIPWNEWSREAKGALLLAEHEGKGIEYVDAFEGEWIEDPDFSRQLPAHDDLYYRIKPEPVRETVTLMIDDGSMGGPQAIGTIDLIDGEPDFVGVKWRNCSDRS